MSVVPSISSMVDILWAWPRVLSEIPDHHAWQREELRSALGRASGGLSRALDCLGIHCRALSTCEGEINSLANGITAVEVVGDSLVRGGIMHDLVQARAELKRLLRDPELKLRFFFRRRLLQFLPQLPEDENDCRFVEELADLLREAICTFGAWNCDEIQEFLWDLKDQLRKDIDAIQDAMLALDKPRPQVAYELSEQ